MSGFGWYKRESQRRGWHCLDAYIRLDKENIVGRESILYRHQKLILQPNVKDKINRFEHTEMIGCREMFVYCCVGIQTVLEINDNIDVINLWAKDPSIRNDVSASTLALFDLQILQYTPLR